MKLVNRLAVIGLIGGMTVLNAGCWEIALAIALAEGDDDAYADPYADDPYADPYYDPYADPAYDPYADPYSSGVLEVRNESLSGTLGEVRGFEGNIWMESGYDYGGVASLQVDAKSTEEDWAVMAALTIEGGLDHPDLVPGAVLTFRYDDYSCDYSGEESRQLHVSLLGCSGPADAYWEYDVTADEVTIEVQDGSTPESRRIAYTGTWSDGSTVQGVVEARAL